MSQFDKEMEEIDNRLAAGEITNEEHRKEVRELLRAYRDAAEEAAEEAYRHELERW